MPLYQFDCQCGRSETDFRSVDGRNAPKTCKCGKSMERVISSQMVMPDLAPYIAVAGDRAGRPVEGRKAHREFLKRNDFREVGNEPIRPIRNNFKPAPGAVREELRRVAPEVLRRHRGG